MSQEIMIPQNFAGSVPEVFKGVGGADELSAGVTGGFGIVTYKGKVWRTKFRGEEQMLMAADGRNARPELEVVIVKAAPMISKVFYETGFVDGSNAPPDCWSVNGLVPDPAASKKQSNTCAGCKQNAWGSRISEAGKQGKACSDNKRLAIVPAADIRNEAMGGPMMLRVPPASLQDMATFGKQMELKGFPYYSFITRLRFDPDEAYPKFVFEPVRPLTEEEAKLVIEMRNDPVTQRILEAPVVDVQHDTEPVKPLPPATDLFTPAAAQVVAAVAAAQPTTAVSQDTIKEPTAEARNPVRPRFDPNTGEPIVYADEQPPKPRFDPMTGKPITDADPGPIPQGLVREQPKKAAPAQPVVAAKPAVAEPPAEGKIEAFDAALDNLLGTSKK